MLWRYWKRPADSAWLCLSSCQDVRIHPGCAARRMPGRDQPWDCGSGGLGAGRSTHDALLPFSKSMPVISWHADIEISLLISPGNSAEVLSW